MANKWHSQRRAMTIKFQALHFAIYGADYRTEACHRLLNLSLIKDAMKTLLDRDEYKEFCLDVEHELSSKDDLDGIR